MLFEHDVNFKFFKKLYFFAKFISGPGIELIFQYVMHMKMCIEWLIV